ncbi:MAG: hypothetical protein HQL23_02695 [Candidatus Omnitrophica bacterium]|nr:hypothetical protein [Candidatus Omnitrophota bacterium]
MNPLRGKLAVFLTGAAYKGIGQLDQKSPLAKELKKFDFDAVLKDDIAKICDKISFFEMTKVMALAAQVDLRLADQEKQKSEIKKIAHDVIERIERESGKLRVPQACLEMLFNL